MKKQIIISTTNELVWVLPERNRLYLVRRQLFDYGAARQDGAKDELDHIKKQRGGRKVKMFFLLK